MQELDNLSLIVIIGVISILFVQSTLLFIDARKHTKYPWVWGIVGLIQFPFPTIFYLIFVRKIFKKFKFIQKNKG